MHLTKAAPLPQFPCTKIIVKLTEINCHLPIYRVYDDYAIHKCACKPNLIVYTLLCVNDIPVIITQNLCTQIWWLHTICVCLDR